MMSYPYYAPYNYPMYQGPRFDQQQYVPPNGPQNAAQAVLPQGNVNQTQVQTGFLCRPVTGKEEALGVQAEYFSPGTLMPDLGHGVVYLKRFNQNTGASDFFEFALVQGKAEDQTTYGEPVPPKILETISGQLNALFERMDDISSKIGLSQTDKGVIAE